MKVMNKSDLINALFSSLGAFLCIGLLAYLNSFFSDALCFNDKLFKSNKLSEKYLKDKSINKIIFVKNRLINLLINE